MSYIRQDICIGHNIRRLRKKAELTQSQVVAKMQILGCDICRASYGKIEAGNHTIRITDIFAIMDIFNCSADDIFKR